MPVARSTFPIRSAVAKPLPTSEFIASRYVTACRQLMAAAEKLDAFDEPSIEIELVPSESRAAIANAILTARGLKLDLPWAITATGLRATARFPLVGETPAMIPLELTADELLLPRDVHAQGVRASVRGSLNPARFKFEPGQIELSADLVNAEGMAVTAFAGRFIPGPLPKLRAEMIARFMDSPLVFIAETDFAVKTASVKFEGALAPGWLDLVSNRVGRDVRKFVDFTTPIITTGGSATFGADWKFERLAADVDAHAVNAYHVMIDAGRGRVELTPKHFYASEAQARLGNNFARGSYEQMFGSREFRFLLEGRLLPLDISGWFGPWWPNFFHTFEFPGGPPQASVDVAGRWGEGWRTTVFVFADVNSPVIRGARLDRARTLLFIRPGFYDGLETLGTLGEGLARGTFTYQLEPATFAWKQFDFAGVSSIDLDVAGKLIGPISADWLSPFKFERPPALKISGRLEHDAGRGLSAERADRGTRGRRVSIPRISAGTCDVHGDAARRRNFDRRRRGRLRGRTDQRPRRKSGAAAPPDD